MALVKTAGIDQRQIRRQRVIEDAAANQRLRVEAAERAEVERARREDEARRRHAAAAAGRDTAASAAVDAFNADPKLDAGEALLRDRIAVKIETGQPLSQDERRALNAAVENAARRDAEADAERAGVPPGLASVAGGDIFDPVTAGSVGAAGAGVAGSRARSRTALRYKERVDLLDVVDEDGNLVLTGKKRAAESESGPVRSAGTSSTRRSRLPAVEKPPAKTKSATAQPEPVPAPKRGKGTREPFVPPPETLKRRKGAVAPKPQLDESGKVILPKSPSEAGRRAALQRRAEEHAARQRSFQTLEQKRAVQRELRQQLAAAQRAGQSAKAAALRRSIELVALYGIQPAAAGEAQTNTQKSQAASAEPEGPPIAFPAEAPGASTSTATQSSESSAAGTQTTPTPGSSPGTEPTPGPGPGPEPGTGPAPTPTPTPQPSPSTASIPSPASIPTSSATPSPEPTQTPGSPTGPTPAPSSVKGPPAKPFIPPPGDDLPDVKLPAGRYASKVQWRQGQKYRQLDLNGTGRPTTTNQPVAGGVAPGVTPSETIKVIETSSRPPRMRTFRLGLFMVMVQVGRITFDRLYSSAAAKSTAMPSGRPIKNPGFKTGVKNPGFTR